MRGEVYKGEERKQKRKKEQKKTKKTKKQKTNAKQDKQREQKQKYLQDDSVITIVDCGAGWHERVRGLGIRGV